MPALDVNFVPEMSQDSRVRVYRGNRIRTNRTSNLPGPEVFDGMEVDSYVLVTERFVLLCDTMICPEDMAIVMAFLPDDLAKRSLMVINSHADWDHAWGNAYFTGDRTVPIIGHVDCRTRMQSEKDRTLLTSFQHKHPKHFQAVELVPPTVTFQDKWTLYGGDLTIELFSAPGHCRDHIAAWIPELSLLLAFDAVETPLPLIKNVAGVQSMFTTLERFQRLQPQRVLCSHGATTSASIIETNLNYFREIERRCRTVLKHHLPTAVELEQAATLIEYSLDDVIAGVVRLMDIPDYSGDDFYSRAHNDNVRYIMQWLMS
jgi:glyoxylase-like metal-dependent hydrolase (beta-lactamase superfamily II)